MVENEENRVAVSKGGAVLLAMNIQCLRKIWKSYFRRRISRSSSAIFKSAATILSRSICICGRKNCSCSIHTTHRKENIFQRSISRGQLFLSAHSKCTPCVSVRNSLPIHISNRLLPCCGVGVPLDRYIKIIAESLRCLQFTPISKDKYPLAAGLGRTELEKLAARVPTASNQYGCLGGDFHFEMKNLLNLMAGNYWILSFIYGRARHVSRIFRVETTTAWRKPRMRIYRKHLHRFAHIEKFIVKTCGENVREYWNDWMQMLKREPRRYNSFEHRHGRRRNDDRADRWAREEQKITRNDLFIKRNDLKIRFLAG